MNQQPHRTPIALRSIALFEIAKGILVLAAAYGIISLRHTDLHAAVDAFLLRHGIDPETHFRRLFIESIAKATHYPLAQIVTFACAYALVRFVEGIGLWRGKAWAEWFAVVSVGLYLPLELLHFGRHPTTLGSSIILLNIAVMVYLAKLLVQQQKAKHSLSKSNMSGKITALLFLVLTWRAAAEEITLGTHGLVSFAPVEAATHILTNRDDFISALSPFDRAARMKTDRAVSEEEFLEFAGKNVRPWLATETNQVIAALHAVRQRLAPWELPFPAAIPLIKTSGLEEGNACYTRQTAVVVAQKEIRSPNAALEDLIIHELFHVLSRSNPELRARLYRIIGFNRINEIVYPGELRPRIITNPDGVQNGWAISITNQNQALSAVPMLFASASRYDSRKGGEFFDYLTFKLLVVTNDDGHWQSVVKKGRPYLLGVEQANGFFEQVGRNTDYIIHPDEILAVNFVHLINGETNLPTPRMVEEMKKVFRGQ